jgi:ketosteroid isomerase-like protein
MRSADEAVVLAFNAAINRRDLPGLGRLMADDHRFIDTAGNTFTGKPACLEAWRGFFASFPDYRNVFDNVRSSPGGIVETHGRSECSMRRLPDQHDGERWWRTVWWSSGGSSTPLASTDRGQPRRATTQSVA